MASVEKKTRSTTTARVKIGLPGAVAEANAKLPSHPRGNATDVHANKLSIKPAATVYEILDSSDDEADAGQGVPGRLSNNSTATVNAVMPRAAPAARANGRGVAPVFEISSSSSDDEDEVCLDEVEDLDAAVAQEVQRFGGAAEFDRMLESARYIMKNGGVAQLSDQHLAVLLLELVQLGASPQTNTVKYMAPILQAILARACDVAASAIESCHLKVDIASLQSVVADSPLSKQISRNFVKDNMRHLHVGAFRSQAADVYAACFPVIDEGAVNVLITPDYWKNTSSVMYGDMGKIVTHMGLLLRKVMVGKDAAARMKKEKQQQARDAQKLERQGLARRFLQEVMQENIRNRPAAGGGAGRAAEKPAPVTTAEVQPVPMGPLSARRWSASQTGTRLSLGTIKHHPKQNLQFRCISGFKDIIRINTRYFMGKLFQAAPATRPCWNRNNEACKPLCEKEVDLADEKSSFQITTKSCSNVWNEEKIEVFYFYCPCCTARFELV